MAAVSSLCVGPHPLLLLNLPLLSQSKNINPWQLMLHKMCYPKSEGFFGWECRRDCIPVSITLNGMLLIHTTFHFLSQPSQDLQTLKNTETFYQSPCVLFKPKLHAVCGSRKGDVIKQIRRHSICLCVCMCVHQMTSFQVHFYPPQKLVCMGITTEKW